MPAQKDAPRIEPATWKGRGGMTEETQDYEESWQTTDFQTYEGLTQAEFQDRMAPFCSNGRSVPVDVPKGWRRTEGVWPGHHFYVHMETGTISKFPHDLYQAQKETWINKHGRSLTTEELDMDPYEQALRWASEEQGKPWHWKGAEAESLLAVPKAKPKKAPKAAKKKAAPKKKAVAGPAEDEEDVAAPQAALSQPSMPVCLLFPGQGSQYVKMLADVKDIPAVRQMLSTAKEILGFDLLELCTQGPESKLEQTQFCQPAMYVGGLAAVEKLRQDKPEVVARCQAVAGLSLGEYTALTVAGVLPFEAGLRLVKLRGEAMQEAAEASPQSMLSVAGLDQATLDGLCAEVRTEPGDVCQIANVLFPKGFSVAGSAKCVEALQQKATAHKDCLQAKLLKTSGGFHTSLMAGAKAKLVEALEAAEGDMQPPRCDVYLNITGEKIGPETQPSEIIPLLGEQLTGCVLWEPSCRAMLKDGITEFYECGPMKQLKAMMKRIDTKAFQATTSVPV